MGTPYEINPIFQCSCKSFKVTFTSGPVIGEFISATTWTSNTSAYTFASARACTEEIPMSAVTLTCVRTAVIPELQVAHCFTCSLDCVSCVNIPFSAASIHAEIAPSVHQKDLERYLLSRLYLSEHVVPPWLGEVTIHQDYEILQQLYSPRTRKSGNSLIIYDYINYSTVGNIRILNGYRSIYRVRHAPILWFKRRNPICSCILRHVELTTYVHFLRSLRKKPIG